MQVGELLTRDERRVTSHVVLDGDDDEYGAHVFFARTKNGRNHRLPLGPMTTELLRRRQASAADESTRRGFGAKSRGFVFPARSKQSKTGHYLHATTLLDALRDEAGIEKLTRHDLRRSFGAMMTTLDVPEGVRKRFFNHADASVTDTYTRAEWAMLRDWMARIEQEILAKAPNVYNSLKPVDWPMIAASEPHVCVCVCESVFKTATRASAKKRRSGLLVAKRRLNYSRWHRYYGNASERQCPLRHQSHARQKNLSHGS